MLRNQSRPACWTPGEVQGVRGEAGQSGRGQNGSGLWAVESHWGVRNASVFVLEGWCGDLIYFKNNLVCNMESLIPS